MCIHPRAVVSRASYRAAALGSGPTRRASLAAMPTRQMATEKEERRQPPIAHNKYENKNTAASRRLSLNYTQPSFRGFPRSLLSNQPSCPSRLRQKTIQTKFPYLHQTADQPTIPGRHLSTHASKGRRSKQRGAHEPREDRPGSHRQPHHASEYSEGNFTCCI